MKIIYCDICGEEISNPKHGSLEKGSVKLTNNFIKMEHPKDIKPYMSSYEDVCKKCYDKIENFIRELA